MTASGIDHTEHRRAVAAMREWDWAPYDDPMTYADLHHGPVTDGRDPVDVARKLWRDLQARRVG